MRDPMTGEMDYQERIALALERIAAALEELVRRK